MDRKQTLESLQRLMQGYAEVNTYLGEPDQERLESIDLDEMIRESQRTLMAVQVLLDEELV